MAKQARFLLAGFAALCAAASLHAEYSVSDTGLWPTNWPKELEALRKQSRTLGHDQQKVYEIPLADRLQFEAAWPHILAVKTPEAPIILLTSPNERLGKSIKAGVRILAPLTGELISPEGGHYPPSAEGIVTNLDLLRIGPPWPGDLKSKSGALPEFVVYDAGGWAPYSATNQNTTSPIRERCVMRARTDVEVIVDGDIVDLNRISLPSDTPIVDKRFYLGATGAVRSPRKDLVEAKVIGPELAGTVRIELADSERNILQNPGFEAGTEGWFIVGPSDTRLEIVTEWPHSGAAAARVLDRASLYCGIAQSVRELMQPGVTYQCSAWVRLGNATGEPISILIRQIDESNNGEPRHRTLARIIATSNEWTQLTGTFTLDVRGTLKDLIFYFEGPAAGVDFLVDDVSIVPAQTAEAKTRPAQLAPSPPGDQPWNRTKRPALRFVLFVFVPSLVLAGAVLVWLAVRSRHGASR